MTDATTTEAPAPEAPEEATAPDAETVGPEVFLAAKLRAALLENAQLRQAIAVLQDELNRSRTAAVNAEIRELEEKYQIEVGTTISSLGDGTYRRSHGNVS